MPWTFNSIVEPVMETFRGKSVVEYPYGYFSDFRESPQLFKRLTTKQFSPRPMALETEQVRDLSGDKRDGGGFAGVFSRQGNSASDARLPSEVRRSAVNGAY